MTCEVACEAADVLAAAAPVDFDCVVGPTSGPACRRLSCGQGSSVTLCTVQSGPHCGSYQSFGVANLAWDLFEKSALP
ncbi:hypothetical protein WME98_05055 [Sorangium sp. So ce296]|uniref:hypothetical protein n=1 Tax=Sorangium sp. So ce296 TaxID=3133296 RepID=UPI003F62E432